jgi:hypothetical protein
MKSCLIFPFIDIIGLLCKCPPPSVADSIRGNLYCLARELVFWWCGRVFLLITQVKLQRAYQYFNGWVTATRYKWWQGWDEDSSRYGRGFVRGRWGLSSWTADAVAEQVPDIQRELTSSFGTKLPWEGGSVADSIRGNYTALPES